MVLELKSDNEELKNESAHIRNQNREVKELLETKLKGHKTNLSICSMKPLLILLFVILSTDSFSQTMADGLLGQWPLDGDAQDVSINQNHGMITGNISSAPDRNGNPTGAMYFDGNSFITRIGIGGIRTVSAWFNVESFQEDERRIFDWRITNGFSVFISRTGQGIIRYDGQANQISGAYINVNEWHHVAGVHDGTTLLLYLDATLLGSLVVAPNDASGTFFIGSRNGGAQKFKGVIDDVRAWDRALSASELLDLYEGLEAPALGSWLKVPGTEDIHYSLGNVGINTSTPTYKLDVNGSLNATSILINGTPLSTGPSSQWTTTGSDIFFNAGVVGIGTNLPSNPNNYKLAVDGKIGAKEVQVENTSAVWPDYVFEADYNLPSFDEVESFVAKNKHLPEVPSSKEIEKDGHKLGEIDVILLKKIEELTLYVIELKKEIEILKQK